MTHVIYSTEQNNRTETDVQKAMVIQEFTKIILLDKLIYNDPRSPVPDHVSMQFQGVREISWYLETIVSKPKVHW